MWSILAGFLLATVLSMGVFAGGTEPVITGSLMLGFAAGWSMLAALSDRYTNQPQKWAYVPAAYMSLVGLFLLLVRPGNGVIRTLGWVWPFLVAGLVVWMYLQVRKQLHSRTRYWVIYPVLAVLALGAVGGIFEKVHEQNNKLTLQGQLVDVGGYRFHIQCIGSGSPTVVLEAGLGEPSSIMSAWIAPTVAKQTRVCVYDREGRGWSEESPQPLNGDQTAEALHNLLIRAHISGPFVVAGHSAGGIYTLNYAKKYPSQVEGVALIDSMTPYQYERISGWSGFYELFRRASALVPTLMRTGIGRLVYSSAYSDIPSPSKDQERNFWGSPELWRSQRDEFSVIRTSLRQAQELKTLGNKPLYVISGQKGEQDGWGTAQDQMAKLSMNSIHQTVTGATHQSLVEEQKYAAKSAHAILQVVSAVRTGNQLTK